jgi:hypothetical protein
VHGYEFAFDSAFPFSAVAEKQTASTKCGKAVRSFTQKRHFELQLSFYLSCHIHFSIASGDSPLAILSLCRTVRNQSSSSVRSRKSLPGLSIAISVLRPPELNKPWEFVRLA